MAKKLLTEEQVRRMRQLAGMSVLSEMGMPTGAPGGMAPKKDEEEAPPGNYAYKADDEPMDDEPMDDEPMDDEPMGGDEFELTPEQVDILEQAADLLDDIVGAAKGSESDDEGEDEEPLDMGGEDEEPLDMDDEDEEPLDMDDEDEDLKESIAKARRKYLSNPKFLAEVSRRVAKRLSEKS